MEVSVRERKQNTIILFLKSYQRRQDRHLLGGGQRRGKAYGE